MLIYAQFVYTESIQPVCHSYVKILLKEDVTICDLDKIQNHDLDVQRKLFMYKTNYVNSYV